jgi:signal transduction histidine kinase
MSSAATERLLGSTGFRLSAAYAALLVIAFLSVAMAAWVATRSAADRDMRERINLEMISIQYETDAEGMQGAERFIRSRIESPGALEYRLANTSGAVVVGNLKIKNPALGWAKVTQRIAGDRQTKTETNEFLTLTQAMPNGSILTIGDDIRRAEVARSIVLRTLVLVAIPTLILFIGIGVVLAMGTARRMRVLVSAMEQVGRGDLAAKAPEAGSDEIARIGRSVNEMVARIESLVASVRRVSTDIAHDLRTPLAHMRQELEAAAKSADMATTHEGIRAAQAKIDDILRIFQAILRLAEIDAGGARARFSQVDLAAVVERVADAYQPDVESADHALLVDPLERTEVLGDSDLIAQALANLVENAMSHTPPRTSIRIGLRKTGAFVGFFIEDSGAGIPETERGRVLEPFVRLDSSRSTPGAGLGLSIVNAIARLHGARLSLEDAKPGLRVAMEWPA